MSPIGTYARVGVVILNWNGADLTLPCIDSLLSSTLIPSRIVIVDNGSTDNSVICISRRFPGIEIIRNETNRGFAEGCNIGIRCLLDGGIDYIWLLNNDTCVDRQCLAILMRDAESQTGVCGWSGKILFPKPDKRIWYAGAKVSCGTLTVRHRGQFEVDRGQYDEPSDVPFLSGCCMLVKTTSFQIVGLFDQRFFAYSEDLDWCLRVTKAGLRMRYVPEAIIYHKVSQTVRKHRADVSGGTTPRFVVYLNHKNRLLILRKHATTLTQRSLSALSYFGAFLIYLAGVFVLGRWDKGLAAIKGTYDGLAVQLDGDSRIDEPSIPGL